MIGFFSRLSRQLHLLDFEGETGKHGWWLECVVSFRTQVKVRVVAFGPIAYSPGAHSTHDVT